MNKPAGIRGWFAGGNRNDRAQSLGQPGTPYFRYDPSHHLHKQINKLRLSKNVQMLLLAVWLIVTGVLQLAAVAVAGIGYLAAILGMAAGILILLSRRSEGRTI